MLVKLVPGSSVKVKVITAVSPILSAPGTLVMVAEGGTVSTVIVWLSARLTLPAASVAVALSICPP